MPSCHRTALLCWQVLAAVYGPHDMGRGDTRGLRPLHDRVVVNCQYSMAVFSTGERKRRPRGDRKSQEMSQHLKQTFEATIKVELYPRSQIDIFVEVLQADGGNYCACVNAATLALIDAGIPLVDYVSACTASLVQETPLVDVSSLESTTGGPELTVAAHPKVRLFKRKPTSILNLTSLQLSNMEATLERFKDLP